MASILKVDELQGIVSAGDITVTSEGGAATQSLQQGLAKAWMKFNASSGTPTINDSLNFSSFTDTAVGNHKINFASAFSNADYAFPIGASLVGTDGRHSYNTNDAPSTTIFRIGTSNSSNSAVDATHCSVSFFGDLA